MSYPPPMNVPPALPYASPTEQSKDDAHLKTLAICHYVWGGLSCLISSCFIGHVVLGIMTISGKLAPSPSAPNNGMDPAFGWIFVAFGSIAVLVGWTAGILNIVSGYSMRYRRRRVLSLIIAGVNCLSVPIGTTLGVFTFIVLLRESVAAEYKATQLQPDWPAM